MFRKKYASLTDWYCNMISGTKWNSQLLTKYIYIYNKQNQNHERVDNK